MDSLQFVVVAVGFLTVLGIFLAIVLVVANKYLFVYEDPRIDEVEAMLPAANCGACGNACDPGEFCNQGVCSSDCGNADGVRHVLRGHAVQLLSLQRL